MQSATPFTDLRQRLIQMPPMNTPPTLHHNQHHYQNFDANSSSQQRGECASPTRRNGLQASPASPSYNNPVDHPLNPTSPPPLPFRPSNQHQSPRNSRQRVSPQGSAKSSTMPPSISSSLQNSSPSTSGTRRRCPQNDVMTPDEMLPSTDAIHQHRRHRGKQYTQQHRDKLPSESSFIFRRRQRSSTDNNVHALDCITEQSPSTNGGDSNRDLKRSIARNTLSISSRWIRNAGGRGRGSSNNERSYDSIQNTSSMTREQVGIDTMETSISTSSESQSMNNDDESFETPQPMEQSRRDQTAIELRDAIDNQISPLRSEDFLHSNHSSPNSRQQATDLTSSPVTPSRGCYNQPIPPNTVHSLPLTPPLTPNRPHELGVRYDSGNGPPSNTTVSNRQNYNNIRRNGLYNQRFQSSPTPYYLRRYNQYVERSQPNPTQHDDESWIGDVLHAAQMAGRNDIMNGDKTTTEDVLQELRHMSTPPCQTERLRHSQQMSNLRHQTPQKDFADDQTWMYDALQSKDSDPSEVLKLLRQQPLQQSIERHESPNKSIPSKETTMQGDDLSWWHDVLDVQDDVPEDVFGELKAYVHRKSIVSNSSIDYSSSSHSSDGSSDSSCTDTIQLPNRTHDTREPVPIDSAFGSDELLKSLPRSRSDDSGSEQAALDSLVQEDEELRAIKEDLLEQMGSDRVIPKEVLQALGLPENFLEDSSVGTRNSGSMVDNVNDINIRTKFRDSKNDDSNIRGIVDSAKRERQRKLQSFHRKQSQHARFHDKTSFSSDDDSSWMEDVRQSKKIGKIPSDILKALGVSETSLDLGSDHLTVDSRGMSTSDMGRNNCRPVFNEDLLESFSFGSSGPGTGSLGSTKGTVATSIEQDARGPIPSDLLAAAFAESSGSNGTGPSSNAVRTIGSHIIDSHSKSEDQSKSSSDVSQAQSSPFPLSKEGHKKTSFQSKDSLSGPLISPQFVQKKSSCHSQDSPVVPLIVPKLKKRLMSPHSTHSSLSNADDETVGVNSTKPNTRFLSKINNIGRNDLDDVYPRIRASNDNDVLARAMQLRLEVLESMNASTASEEKKKKREKKERKNTHRLR